MKFKIHAIKGTRTNDRVNEINEISIKSNFLLKPLNKNIVIGANKNTNKKRHNKPPGSKLKRFM